MYASPRPSPARLLLVAPDHAERQGWQRCLQTPDRHVFISRDPRSVDDAPQRGIHLLLLDPRVEPSRPGRTDAWWRLRRLREQHRQLPVIVLQPAGDATDRAVAYEMGADAVMDLRSSARELRAQVGALLRRSRDRPTPCSAPAVALDHGGEPARFGGWTLDAATRCLTTATGMQVNLSPAECRLLRAFLAHPGHALARQALIDLARGVGTDQLERNIDLLVSRLRQKLSHDDAPSPIRTVRGVGYLFEAVSAVNVSGDDQVDMVD